MFVNNISGCCVLDSTVKCDCVPYNFLLCTTSIFYRTWLDGYEYCLDDDIEVYKICNPIKPSVYKVNNKKNLNDNIFFK